MAVIKDVDPSFENEDEEVSEQDSSIDDDDVVLTGDEEREGEEFSDDEDFAFSEKEETEEEELSDDVDGVSQEEEEEEVKIHFLQVENLNTWYAKNYKLAVEVIGAQGIDSSAKPGAVHLYYAIVFTCIGVVRKTELSFGHNSSVWWRANRPLIFPVDGLDLLRRRTEKDKNSLNENYYDDEEDEEEEEFVYFQIIRADSFDDDVGTSHGNMVVGQARVNVPLSLIPFHFDLHVIEPFRLGGRWKGLLRVKMTLLNMIPSREGQVIGWNVGGDPAVAERRRTTAAKGININ